MRDGKPVQRPYEYTFLMHGTTYHGRNYLAPRKGEMGGVDLSRLATTYYHRYGPVGIVMERDNWFPGAQNTFRADARLPAAIFGLMGGDAMGPLAALGQVWAEPPFATIGLGTGTMVSYAHPYQWMTYYEIDDVIREFSLPPDPDAPIPEGLTDPDAIELAKLRPREAPGHFTYLQNAVKRGVNLEVIMGDARQSLAFDREKNNKDNSFVYSFDFEEQKRKGAAHGPTPSRFNAPRHSPSPNRQKFYKAINVDAFSSDAIPVHLVTRQAIELYLSKLTDDGVLMLHTSNRHMDLVVPVSRIALQLSKEYVKEAEKDVDGGEADPKKRPTEENERRLYELVGLLCGTSSSTLKPQREILTLEKAKAAYIKSQEASTSGSVRRTRRQRKATWATSSSEYVMIYRGDGFAKYLDGLQAKRAALIKAGRMKDGGAAPDGDQILNSQVTWYDPFESHDRQRLGACGSSGRWSMKDSLWTDDYSYIPGCIRWPWWVPIGK